MENNSNFYNLYNTYNPYNHDETTIITTVSSLQL